VKQKIERVIQKGEKQLTERGISMEEDAGHFYGILETNLIFLKGSTDIYL